MDNINANPSQAEDEINKVRQNLRTLERKLLLEEMAAQETTSSTEKYKTMSMRMSQDVQNIKWKIFRADLIQRYERAKRQNYLDKIRTSFVLRENPRFPRSSRGDLEEYTEQRKNLSDRLEELVKACNEKEQKIINLELEVNTLKEENTALMDKLQKDLEEKEEEERKLEEELEELKAEEQKLNFSFN